MYIIPVYVVSEFAQTGRLPPTSPSLAGWPGGVQGKRDLHGCFYHFILAAARVEALLEGLLLPLALAGPAGDLKNALLWRRLGCYVADCA